LDDGVPDSISSLMVFSRDHTPKTFHVPSCTSTCSGAPFWKPSNSLILIGNRLFNQDRRHSPMGLRY
jgi:hypothetical protein